ncbi:MAG: prolipoprotein diacylglyceryl transferase [Ruminococcus sp.]|nr:prolipoprotein diacylglyceryl transferase [Ruminococcus sp.]
MLQAVQLLTEQYETMWEKLGDHPNRVYFPNFGSGDNVLKTGIDIDRVMFKIPGTNFQIYWYGFLIAVGIILAMIYGFKKMKKAGIDPDRATDAVIGGFFGAIIGARLYYIIFSDTPLSKFFDFRDGGLAIYGGLIGAIVVGGIIVKLRKLRLTAMLDIVAPCFFIGQAIGRWGNFFNQEAFGTNTTLPWGMLSNTTANYVSSHITDGSVEPLKPIHPCFLYESLWCLLGFVLLHIYFKHRKFDGEVFLCYTTWYGLGRFFIEGLRTDSLYLGSMRVSQLLAAACVIVSLVVLIIVRVRITKFKDYVFFKDTQLSKAQIAYYDNIKEFEKKKKELEKKISESEDKGENTEDMKAELEEKYGPQARHKLREAIDEAEKADKKAREEKLAARAKLLAEENGETVQDPEQEKDNSETAPQSSEAENEKAQESAHPENGKTQDQPEADEGDIVPVIKDEVSHRTGDKTEETEIASNEPAPETEEQTKPKKKKKKPAQPQTVETRDNTAEKEQASEEKPEQGQKQEVSDTVQSEPQQQDTASEQEKPKAEEDIKAEDIVAEVTQKMKDEKAEKDKQIQEIIAEASEKSEELPSDSDVKVEDIISQVNEKNNSTENAAPSQKTSGPNNKNAKRKNNRSRNRNRKKR